MARGRILVVAPYEALRRSLAFALEAEGYEVTSRDELPYHAWVAEKAFDATVLDQRALIGADYESIAFCVKAHPVVLLATRPHPWLVEWVSDVVETPVIGNAVATALDRAILHGE
jgi:DNA-binding NtrC family response regulator